MCLLYTDTSLDQPCTENEADEVLPEVNILRKERDCQGMLHYRKKDEAKLFKTLITGELGIIRMLFVFGANIKSLFAVLHLQGLWFSGVRPNLKRLNLKLLKLIWLKS